MPTPSESPLPDPNKPESGPKRPDQKRDENAHPAPTDPRDLCDLTANDISRITEAMFQEILAEQKIQFLEYFKSIFTPATAENRLMVEAVQSGYGDLPLLLVFNPFRDDAETRVPAFFASNDRPESDYHRRPLYGLTLVLTNYGIAVWGTDDPEKPLRPLSGTDGYDLSRYVDALIAAEMTALSITEALRRVKERGALKGHMELEVKLSTEPIELASLAQGVDLQLISARSSILMAPERIKPAAIDLPSFSAPISRSPFEIARDATLVAIVLSVAHFCGWINLQLDQIVGLSAIFGVLSYSVFKMREIWHRFVYGS